AIPRCCARWVAGAWPPRATTWRCARIARSSRRGRTTPRRSSGRASSWPGATTRAGPAPRWSASTASRAATTRYTTCWESSTPPLTTRSARGPSTSGPCACCRLGRAEPRRPVPVRPPRLMHAVLLVLLAATSAAAQSPRAPTEAPGPPAAGGAPTPASPADADQAPEAEVMRPRIQARLGMVEEAIAGYRALLERYPRDRSLREEYAETLVDAGLVDQAGPLVDRYLAEDPTSTRLRRLRARLDLAAAASGRGGRSLEAIAREQAREFGIAADLAAAELAAGRWTRALELYEGAIDGDPDNRDALGAYREILLGHAP